MVGKAAEETGRVGRIHSVCVYCASIEGIDPRNLELAAELGAGLAERGWQLVSGGGRSSMMGAVAIAARKNGARTLGVIPHAMVEREWADHESDELLVVDTMRERKQLMEAHANAFIALPGGVGTLEELFEVWTSGYLQMHDKPVVLLDPFGHYTGLLQWVRGLRELSFVRDEAIDRLIVTSTVEAALDACAP